ncbi:hypothetical protein Pcinc_011453 [Petrolisthes cinctipes]|uniref:DDE Tnp4 domain-containing protein n=1 Tax=Petrolisthes cinctipes TaxID=88211 RepID=A0AAE1KUF3_PETCI|nr:hypothetical protein Pcinc_011453 [Petrolisthes cinctipes]
MPKIWKSPPKHCDSQRLGRYRDPLLHLLILHSLNCSRLRIIADKARKGLGVIVCVSQLTAPFADFMRGVITKTSPTFWRKPLDPALRVTITIRFIATGNSYKSLGYAFRVASNTIAIIFPETCRAIIEAFADEYLQIPDSVEGWKQIANRFNERWNIPHTLGALMGSIFASRIQRLEARTTSTTRSSSPWSCWHFPNLQHIMLENKRANLPPAEKLPGDPEGKPVDYFFVEDDAFALRSWMMKPYPERNLSKPERIYNYRLYRARRVVENDFGMLANRFRVFHSTINLMHDRVEAVVMAACVLHNVLRVHNPIRGEADTEDPVT